MKIKLQLSVEELSVTTFETEQAPPAEQSRDNLATCQDTDCPPFRCCA
jgi:hypothetical protein